MLQNLMQNKLAFTTFRISSNLSDHVTAAGELGNNGVNFREHGSFTQVVFRSLQRLGTIFSIHCFFCEAKKLKDG